MSPTEPERRFTVAEANEMLPLLGARLTRLGRLSAAARHAWHELERLVAVGITDDGVLIMAHDYRLTKRRFDQLRGRLNTDLEQLVALGVQVKDIDAGLVDFPAVLDGEEVLLCWRVGEPSVSFYHGYDDGFAGRRPIPPGAP